MPKNMYVCMYRHIYAHDLKLNIHHYMAKKKNKTLNIEGTEIRLAGVSDNEYISLTDITKKWGDEQTLYRWMRNRNTLEFLGLWEQLHNSDFKPIEFDRFKYEAGSNTFSMSPKKWIEGTNAIGMYAKSGRNGGTYAHKDIALEYCSWLKPVIRLYVVKEFQRLKEAEASEYNLEWTVKRIMAKASYPLQTEAIRQHLIPPKIKDTKAAGGYFATEADMLNVALFGISAKEWKLQNPDLKGNLRDHANHEQLLVLSILQGLNAKLIEWDCDKKQRLELLNKAAIDWMNTLLSHNTSLSQLPKEIKKLDK